ncbi:HD-GYP domain-containing protein [Azospirillum picis]|uniref:HD-GYP domain-containing protein (C-di-GMP phosphodiesterase class II) n=1 Tax=Azospirillum picis TaxID=488438 RepID=A0ABU0MNZ5_9PROT|nr:HD domain-containing phosphohydrolase [Azospirillum picis]MBP2301363.1 HD-GYP domain-containing protein (c-di-GMP phosphodiesterase class II) [Azospirillum picis]MDQ0535194.1 HD-GYP domain-containing protein (c-di-GMP phosphodiesterase class II) [Azospirillum picis]
MEQSGGLEERLQSLHEEIREWPGLEHLHRIAVVTYDARAERVRTFAHSNVGPRPLDPLSGNLGDYPLLQAVAETGRPWIDNAIISVPGSTGPGGRLLQQGFRSRYLSRIHWQGSLYGFLFLNSRKEGFFTESIVSALMPYRRVIGVLVASEMTSTRAMLAAVHTALEVSHYRDEETGAHLSRMSRYAQLVAAKIASKHGLSDEFIEYVLQYAPLHDVGKVAIPDSILLKPGKLTPDEFGVMKTHVTKGLDIINAMIHDHGLGALPHAAILRNVVACHHEAFDGSGYPNGLSGEAIPLEARIVAVADVFDALTSVRPYKGAWTNEAAAAFLREQAGRKFDPDCVAALLTDMSVIEAIQQQFRDVPSIPPAPGR